MSNNVSWIQASRNVMLTPIGYLTRKHTGAIVSTALNSYNYDSIVASSCSFVPVRLPNIKLVLLAAMNSTQYSTVSCTVKCINNLRPTTTHIILDPIPCLPTWCMKKQTCMWPAQLIISFVHNTTQYSISCFV